jgi:hypothetical protein
VNLRFTSSKSLLAWQCQSSCCFGFLLSNIELERQAELCCVYDMTSVQVPDEAVCTSLLQIVLFGDRVILSDPIETWALQIAMLSSVQFPDHVQFFFLVGGIGFDSVIMFTNSAEIIPFQNVATCMWSHLGICINFSCQVRVRG